MVLTMLLRKLYCWVSVCLWSGFGNNRSNLHKAEHSSLSLSLSLTISLSFSFFSIPLSQSLFLPPLSLSISLFFSPSLFLLIYISLFIFLILHVSLFSFLFLFFFLSSSLYISVSRSLYFFHCIYLFSSECVQNKYNDSFEFVRNLMLDGSWFCWVPVGIVSHDDIVASI